MRGAPRQASLRRGSDRQSREPFSPSKPRLVSGPPEGGPYVPGPPKRGPYVRSLLFRCLRLAEAGAAQDALERVVVLVARVLVDRFLRERPDVLAGPRLVPRRRILDREPIQQVVGVHACEALDHVQVLRRAAEAGFLGDRKSVV